ncbi:MAG: hypothetical protein VYA34_16325 [Myxococcota bacterium]|nr:hypothetical protein [Myxococcota bacterium]
MDTFGGLVWRAKKLRLIGGGWRSLRTQFLETNSKLRHWNQFRQSLLVVIGCSMACASPPLKVSPSPETKNDELIVIKQLEELRAVFRGAHTPPTKGFSPELLNPKTLKNAQDIVRSDHLGLYKGADAIFKAHLRKYPRDVTNLTWRAQLYLVWVEGLYESINLHELFLSLAQERFDVFAEGLIWGTLTASQEKAARRYTDDFEILRYEVQQAINAMEQELEDKLVMVAELKVKLLRKSLGRYEGHRIAADHFRLTGESEDFARSLKKIEDLNPDSNGLRFLKAMKSMSDNNIVGAIDYLHQALEREPKFVKAQFWLGVFLYQYGQKRAGLDAMHKVLLMSPGHGLAYGYKIFISWAL